MFPIVHELCKGEREVEEDGILREEKQNMEDSFLACSPTMFLIVYGHFTKCQVWTTVEVKVIQRRAKATLSHSIHVRTLLETLFSDTCASPGKVQHHVNHANSDNTSTMPLDSVFADFSNGQIEFQLFLPVSSISQ